MKNDIDKELKFLTVFSGSMVGRFYPLVNIGNKLNKCRSDREVTVKRYLTPGYKGDKISTVIIEPKECSASLPCIIFYHGGGFLMSAMQSHYQIAKWYAKRANCKVVMPDYRLLPKHKYPVAIADCYKTYLWVLKNADRLSINKDKIIITGDSAGGNITAAVTAMLNDRKQPLPQGTMLIYPALDKRMKTGSMSRFNDTPIFDSKCAKIFWDMYLENKDAERAKYASVSEIENLGFFPDTYIEVAEYDCLHDEGVEFADKLSADGVKVELHEEKRTCHGYEAALKSDIVKTCINRRIDWINNIFE